MIALSLTSGLAAPRDPHVLERLAEACAISFENIIAQAEAASTRPAATAFERVSMFGLENAESTRLTFDPVDAPSAHPMAPLPTAEHAGVQPIGPHHNDEPRISAAQSAHSRTTLAASAIALSQAPKAPPQPSIHAAPFPPGSRIGTPPRTDRVAPPKGAHITQEAVTKSEPNATAFVAIQQTEAGLRILARTRGASSAALEDARSDAEALLALHGYRLAAFISNNISPQ